ncbi:hypothetical protein BJX63DRAFT_431163 [Aspergillus granulosus]|uniref:Uncharacterized protein n=1 Tax=Aspergillus granulosus TaxID=176169 RepID=A0ABR4HH89_9EURO
MGAIVPKRSGLMTTSNPSKKLRLMDSEPPDQALQTLSALRFLHAHSICLGDFSYYFIWLRSDFSAAVTGFVGGTLPSDPWLNADHLRALGIEFQMAEEEYDEQTGQLLPASPRGDICDWANLIWGIVTNAHSIRPPQNPALWPMTYSEDPREWPKDYEVNLREETERVQQRMFYELEEAHLGLVLVKAFNGTYQDVSEVVSDVRSILGRRGVEILGDDEILPPGDASWADVFITAPSSLSSHPQGRDIRFRAA